MNIIIFVILSYLIGSIPGSYLIGKIFKGIDIRQYGSKNPGATNVFRVVGVIPGIIAFILDAAKGFLPVFISIKYSGQNIYIPIVVGIFAIAGHIWTIFLNFKGGKGVATAAGVFIALMPLPVALAMLVFGIVLLFTRYVSMSSIIAAFSLPVFSVLLNKPGILNIFALIIAIVIIYTHRSNIKKLIAGEENKVGKSNLQKGEA